MLTTNNPSLINKEFYKCKQPQRSAAKHSHIYAGPQYLSKPSFRQLRSHKDIFTFQWARILTTDFPGRMSVDPKVPSQPALRLWINSTRIIGHSVIPLTLTALISRVPDGMVIKAMDVPKRIMGIPLEEKGHRAKCGYSWHGFQKPWAVDTSASSEVGGVPFSSHWTEIVGPPGPKIIKCPGKDCETDLPFHMVSAVSPPGLKSEQVADVSQYHTLLALRRTGRGEPLPPLPRIAMTMALFLHKQRSGLSQSFTDTQSSLHTSWVHRLRSRSTATKKERDLNL